MMVENVVELQVKESTDAGIRASLFINGGCVMGKFSRLLSFRGKKNEGAPPQDDSKSSKRNIFERPPSPESPDEMPNIASRLGTPPDAPVAARRLSGSEPDKHKIKAMFKQLVTPVINGNRAHPKTPGVENGAALSHNSIPQNPGVSAQQDPEISEPASMNASQSLRTQGSSDATTPNGDLENQGKSDKISAQAPPVLQAEFGPNFTASVERALSVEAALSVKQPTVIVRDFAYDKGSLLYDGVVLQAEFGPNFTASVEGALSDSLIQALPVDSPNKENAQSVSVATSDSQDVGHPLRGRGPKDIFERISSSALPYSKKRMPNIASQLDIVNPGGSANLEEFTQDVAVRHMPLSENASGYKSVTPSFSNASEVDVSMPPDLSMNRSSVDVSRLSDKESPGPARAVNIAIANVRRSAFQLLSLGKQSQTGVQTQASDVDAIMPCADPPPTEVKVASAEVCSMCDETPAPAEVYPEALTNNSRAAHVFDGTASMALTQSKTALRKTQGRNVSDGQQPKSPSSTTHGGR